LKRRSKFAILFVLVLGVVGSCLVHFVAPYGIIQPPKNNEAINPGSFDLVFEDVSIEIDEGQFIKGYWTKSQLENSNAVMIMLHGIGGCKEHYLSLSKNMSILGIDCLLLDGRAHGESDGLYCTYGYHEKKDVSKIVDLIKERGFDGPIGIWGNSMGGAIALQAMANDSRLEFGVIESTFAELRQIVSDYQSRLSFGIRVSFIANYCLDRAGVIANFDPDEVKPIEDVKKITQPIFIAHGDSDKNIRYEYAVELFDNLSSVEKELTIVKDGGHFGLFDAGGQEYFNKIVNFIARQLDN